MPLGREYREQFWMPLNPGALRHRVTIYRRTLSKSETTGADATGYTEVFLSGIPAAMNPNGGSKFYGASRFTDEILESCLMRYIAGITETMQLEWDGKRYEIIKIDDPGERRITLLLALRRVV